MKTRLFFLILILSFLCFGCTKKEILSSDADTKLNVVASFYPVYISLLNLTQGVDNISVSLLAPSDTGCLHNYQLTTKDMSLIESCNLLFINGAGMDDFILENTVDDQKAKIVNSSYGWQGLDHNSHIWLSVDGTIHQTKTIAQELAKFDPENAEIYSLNQKEYTKKLESLKSKFYALQNKLKDTTIVLFNDSFYYLAKDLNLTILDTAHHEHGEEPSAKDLAHLREEILKITASGKKIILLDTIDSSNTSAEIISQETSLPVYKLNPGTSGPLDSNAYILAMESNLSTLEKAANL